VIRFGQDATAYEAPSLLVNVGQIGFSLLFSLVRAAGRPPVRPPAHRDSPSMHSVASASGVMYVSVVSPSDTIEKLIAHGRDRDLDELSAWMVGQA
jgi:hypothetical protein